MEFSQQIQQIRMEHHLSIEQTALMLGVDTKTINDWENNVSYPDMKMLIRISCMFSISPDQMIPGGRKMNQMTEKLIKDTSDNRKTKMNMAMTFSGGCLMVIGLLCFIAKAVSYEYVDAAGMLHEHFWLIPVGLLFLLVGAAIIVINLIARNLMNKR